MDMVNQTVSCRECCTFGNVCLSLQVRLVPAEQDEIWKRCNVYIVTGCLDVDLKRQAVCTTSDGFAATAA
jgi:hypothetical protein